MQAEPKAIQGVIRLIPRRISAASGYFVKTESGLSASRFADFNSPFQYEPDK